MFSINLGNLNVDIEVVIWLALFVILMAIEIATVGLTTIWFAAGSLVSLAAYGLGFGIAVQTIVFFTVSILLLIFTRPFITKYVNKNKLKTNYEGIIGKVVRVTEDVNNLQETGAAIVGGVEWTVRTQSDGIVITSGTIVKVVNIQGVKLIVEEYKG